MDEHMNIVWSENPKKSEAWITCHHIDSFVVWLRQNFMGDGMIDGQLQWLARGPSIIIMQYQGYEINGYTFYTRAQDEKSTKQNSGVRIDAIGNDGNKDNYVGIIEEIWELDYEPLKVPLFRCQWVNRAVSSVTIDRFDITIVDFKKNGYKDKPFILDKDVTQVFYVKDMSSKPNKNQAESDNEPKRHIVLPRKRKIIGVEDISDKSEDFDQFGDRPPFSVDVNPSIL